MTRNLDLTALRSFVAVADTGGVTRAAGYLNLTQSAVSMQIKRLEDTLGAAVIERSGRGVVLTSAGEELLSMARRMLELNDETLRRIGQPEKVGQIVLGVPHDIVFPAIPEVLRQFTAAFPQVKIQLISSLTETLKERFAAGEMDIILTTEHSADQGGEVLTSKPLLWVGAPDGQAWRRRPLRLAHEQRCVFRRDTQRLLDDVGIPWESAVDSDNFRSVSAMLVADLAVTTLLEGTLMSGLEVIRHEGALPALKAASVVMYRRKAGLAEESLAAMLEHAYKS